MAFSSIKQGQWGKNSYLSKVELSYYKIKKKKLLLTQFMYAKKPILKITFILRHLIIAHL